MTSERTQAPEPLKAPESVQVMDTGAQPFLTRFARRAAHEASPEAELPPIAHVPRFVTIAATVLSALLLAIAAPAGETILAAALLLGSLVIACRTERSSWRTRSRHPDLPRLARKSVLVSMSDYGGRGR